MKTDPLQRAAQKQTNFQWQAWQSRQALAIVLTLAGLAAAPMQLTGNLQDQVTSQLGP